VIEANIIERWMEEDEEAREIRRKHADWKFIEEQPEPLRSALKCFVELGDLYVASRIAGLKIDEFNQLRIRAKIPMVI
jgi:hypothetical protein